MSKNKIVLLPLELIFVLNLWRNWKKEGKEPGVSKTGIENVAFVVLFFCWIPLRQKQQGLKQVTQTNKSLATLVSPFHQLTLGL